MIPDTTPEHQFEVVARAYYKLKEMGIQPKLKLLPIGRDTFLLPCNTVHKIRLRARYFVKVMHIPKDIDEKESVWPTEKEQIVHGRS